MREWCGVVVGDGRSDEREERTPNNFMHAEIMMPPNYLLHSDLYVSLCLQAKRVYAVMVVVVVVVSVLFFVLHHHTSPFLSHKSNEEA